MLFVRWLNWIIRVIWLLRKMFVKKKWTWILIAVSKIGTECFILGENVYFSSTLVFKICYFTKKNKCFWSTVYQVTVGLLPFKENSGITFSRWFWRKFQKHHFSEKSLKTFSVHNSSVLFNGNRFSSSYVVCCKVKVVKVGSPCMPLRREIQFFFAFFTQFLFALFRNSTTLRDTASITLKMESLATISTPVALTLYNSLIWYTLTFHL